MKYVTYDIEVLPNVFTCVILNAGEFEIYEVSPRKNDIYRLGKRLMELQESRTYMVGFNNVGYDYPIIHHILDNLLRKEPSEFTASTYEKSQAIINSTNRFEHTFWDNQCYIPQIDLYKMHHFDNFARATSLKRLEFNMRSKDILEFDLPFDKPISKGSDVNKLIRYNKYDVSKTQQFFEISKSAVDFRKEKEWFNFNDTRIGEVIFTEKLKEAVGGHVLYDENGKRQTHRKHMKLSELIFDNVRFFSPEFQTTLERLKELYVFSIKGKFHWNENLDYPDNLDEYTDHRIFTELNGFEFELGKGGLHGTLRKQVVSSDDDFVIIDLDVTSYYPSIGIAYGLYPEHLTEAFCPIYEEVKSDRVSHPKGTDMNKRLKLVLNAVYGKTNSVYSVFYDPKYTIQTTVNGQLMLMMLWEHLSLIQGCSIIQANTDGITIKVRRNTMSQVGRVCRAWQRHTKMQLEKAIYDKMWIRDGNNYIAKYKDGGLKQKGVYAYNILYDGTSVGDIEWHKNHSSIVVKKAATAHLVEGRKIDDFIKNHDNIYDFFLCTNVNRSSRLKWGETPTQRISRYLISNKGEPLIKVMPPLKGKSNEREIGINKDYVTTIHNTVNSDDPKDYDINFDFYIKETEKLTRFFNERE